MFNYRLAQQANKPASTKNAKKPAPKAKGSRGTAMEQFSRDVERRARFDAKTTGAEAPKAKSRQRSAEAEAARWELHELAPEILSKADNLADSPRYKASTVYRAFVAAINEGRRREKVRTDSLLRAMKLAKGKKQKELAQKLYAAGAPAIVLDALPDRFRSGQDLSSDEIVDQLLDEMRKERNR